VVVQPPAAALTAMAAAAGPGSPQPMAGPVPSSCPVATTAARALSLHAKFEQTLGAANPTDQAFPTGTFQVTVTPAQFAAGGTTGPDWERDITFTFTIGADGTVNGTQKPDFPDQGPASGTWTAKGDQVTFRFGQGGDEYIETNSWSYFKGVLHFRTVSVQDAASRSIYGQPWHKVG
jgi:hypothetical protein